MKIVSVLFLLIYAALLQNLNAGKIKSRGNHVIDWDTCCTIREKTFDEKMTSGKSEKIQYYSAKSNSNEESEIKFKDKKSADKALEDAQKECLEYCNNSCQTKYTSKGEKQNINKYKQLVFKQVDVKDLKIESQNLHKTVKKTEWNCGNPKL